MEKCESEFKILESGRAFNRKSLTAPNSRFLMVLIMILSDFLGVLAAVIVAVVLRYLLMGNWLTLDAFSWLPVYIIIFVFSANLRGLYPALGMSAIEQFRHLTIVISILFLVTIGATFFFKVSSNFSRMLLGLSWFCALIIVPFTRTIVRHLMTKTGLWGEKVVVIGRTKGATRVIKYFRTYPKIGLRPEVQVNIPDKTHLLNSEDYAYLLALVQSLRQTYAFRTALVVYDKLDEIGIFRDVFRDVFEKVVLISSHENSIDLGGVNIRQYGNQMTIEVRHSLMNQTAQFGKRMMDVLISGTALLILSPLLLLIALTILIDSPGRIFYHQRRLGKASSEFDMLKFRTMHRNADEMLDKLLTSDPKMAYEWTHYQKLSRDPRITRIGRVLRRFSLDELPQLINVLVGEMSIVGPRPIMPNQQELYGSNFTHYIRVVPGMTGLWQISGRNHTTFSQRSDFDAEYINSWSIWMDIYIMVRTVWVVIRRDGAQ